MIRCFQTTVTHQRSKVVRSADDCKTGLLFVSTSNLYSSDWLIWSYRSWRFLWNELSSLAIVGESFLKVTFRFLLLLLLLLFSGGQYGNRLLFASVAVNTTMVLSKTGQSEGLKIFHNWENFVRRKVGLRQIIVKIIRRSTCWSCGAMQVAVGIDGVFGVSLNPTLFLCIILYFQIKFIIVF